MDRIASAFHGIRAEDALKNRTVAYLSTRQIRKSFPRLRLIAAASAFLILLSVWLYFTPTAFVSIETEPAIELAVNRFDRVLSASSSSSEGQQILQQLNLSHLRYCDAVEQVLSSTKVAEQLELGAVLTVSVIAPEGSQCDRLLTDSEVCTDKSENSHCYRADPAARESVEESGLSWAKYRALQELQALDPTITAGDVRGMTMRQIRNMIDELHRKQEDSHSKNPTEPPPQPPMDEPAGPGQHGKDDGHGNGKGNQHGKESGGEDSKDPKNNL